jgi:DNA-binding response OmpR family regulator
MFNQFVSIVEFPLLYNILKEIEDLFNFNINNYNNSSDFIKEVDKNNTECLNSIIILEKKNNLLSSHIQINESAIVIIDSLPLKIEKFIDIINTQLIKQKYNFQSKLNIKNYILNLNSRIISSPNKELKLTEKEVDIIMFLNESKIPQSINVLQNKVWGHSFKLETHTVETHIYRLRKKIKDQFNDDNFITSHDAGYLI